VDINERRYLILDADDWQYKSPWIEATVHPLAVVNDLLTEAAARVRVFTLHTGRNEGQARLLDPAVVEAVRPSGLVEAGNLPELRLHRRNQ
jgi:hypothetical protein